MSQRLAGAMPGSSCSRNATRAKWPCRANYKSGQRLHSAGRRAALGTGFARSFTASQSKLTKESCMLSWALAFFIIAIIAAIFGFTGIAAGAAEIAKILFVVFVVLFLVSLVAGLLRRP